MVLPQFVSLYPLLIVGFRPHHLNEMSIVRLILHCAQWRYFAPLLRCIILCFSVRKISPRYTILVHTLEYTHTNKGLPLNCQRSRGKEVGAAGNRQCREKPRLFYRISLLTKDEALFYAANPPTFPLIYINLPPP